jgi:hypothetical protein
MKKSKKAATCVRWCWKNFCLVFFCKKNLLRDIAILGALIIALGAILGTNWYQLKKAREASIAETAAQVPLPTEQESLRQEELDVPKIQAQTDTSAWVPYQNTFYGFVLKLSNCPIPTSFRN